MPVLTPPYTRDRSASSIEGNTLAFGSILIVPALGEGEELGRLLELSDTNPWCPVVALESRPDDGGTRRIIHRLFPSVVFACPMQSDHIERVLDAVRSRIVSAERLRHMLITRLGDRERVAFLSAGGCERPWGVLNCSRSRFYEVWRRHIPMRRRSWRNVVAISAFAGWGYSPEQIAGEIGSDWRTVRATIQRVIGVSAREFREFVGWEWALESALRHAGVFADTAAPPCPR